jgi:alpha-mannosidase
MRIAIMILAAILFLPPTATNQSTESPKTLREGTLGVVATSHLDTQWRWTIQNTINEYVPATLRDNFKLLDIYPDYTFSFEGAFRYMLAKEYYPAEYERLKKHVADGRWRVAGSWVDAVDVNIPSFESLVRQTLYGNGFFKKEFGKTSRDIFLPDCFGFGYALPSIAAHCGLQSFSTQKLTWGCSVPVPFDIGIWEGVDGSSIIAGLQPGNYVAQIESDLSRDSTWMAHGKNQGDSTGLYAAYMYFGTGDTGGAPDSLSVDRLEKSIHSDGPLEVRSIGSDDLPDIVGGRFGLSPEEMNFVLETWGMPNSFTPALQEKLSGLKLYNGELLMTRHGVGCYTSQAAMKRWNRKNELLADATERACVIAYLLGVSPYPREALRDTWVRFLWHQFHDDLTGTSIPEAYQFSWSDELLCQNRFSAMLEHAVEAVASQLDTRVKGLPLVIYNPLSTMREDVVEATIPCKDTVDAKERNFMTFRVFETEGKEVPSSVVECDHLKNKMTINFLARVPSVGFAVYDVRPAETMCQMETGLVVSESTLENMRYLVKINKAGEVASIYDKGAKRELLSAPIAFQFLHDKPDRWPAWEIQYNDVMAPPLTGVMKDTKIEIVETGPVRVSLLVTQKTDRSILRTTISLAAGDAGDRVEFDNEVDWYQSETLLKVAFPVTTSNDSVTYDIGLGTIKRGLNTEKKYEVPGHQWADITAEDGSYGVSVLNDCKYGWDHPDSATLRLSLIHTPGVFESWNWVGDQKSQDMGRHHFKFSVAGHKEHMPRLKSTWQWGNSVWKAARLNQPLISFRTKSHNGYLGNEFALIEVFPPPNPFSQPTYSYNSNVFVNGLKFAENSDEIIVRLRETKGQAGGVSLHFGTPQSYNRWEIISAREVNGAEEHIDSLVSGYTVKAFWGSLNASFTPYQPKALAVKLKKLGNPPIPDASVYNPLELVYDLDGISLDANRTDGDFDGVGNTIAGELLPDTLVWLDAPYVFGPKEEGRMNALSCKGQTIEVTGSDFNQINLLVTSVGGPSAGIFKIDGKSQVVRVPDYSMPIGQWNSRLSGDEFVEKPERIAPAYINTTPVAWYGSHRHTAQGENEAYKFTYLFLLSFDLPPGAKEIRLPDNPRIKVMAATLVKTNREKTFAAQPLYDRADATLANIHSDHHSFFDSTLVSINTPIPGAAIFYTVDGSEPNTMSQSYNGPFSVSSTSTVKARAFQNDFDNGYVAQASFTKLLPREPVTLGKVVQGLRGNYYEGELSKLPNFDTLKIIKSFGADQVALPEFAREEDFGLTLEGFIKVPADGLYEFYLSSDDGSKLYISDTLVVDNDGLHGSGDVGGEIALKAGFHPISIDMFQAKGDRDLALSWRGPGVEKQPVPASALFSERK